MAGTKEELEELSKKLSKAISKKDFILAATIQRQLDEMEEQSAQKTNKLENLNKKLVEAISKKDYTLAATIHEEIVKMEEHAGQKTNTLKDLNIR